MKTEYPKHHLLIEKLLHHFFNRIGWDINYNLTLKLDKSLNHLLEAYIDMKEWIINVRYPFNFLELFKEINEKYEFYKLYEPNMLNAPIDADNQYKYHQELYNFLAGISFHEFGHSKECPIDLDNFSIILQAVSTNLEQKEKFDNILLIYIVNLFSDMIVNLIYGLDRQNAFFRNSIFTFYFSEIVFYESKDPSYYLFVLLNLKLIQFHTSFRDAFEMIIFQRIFENFDNPLENLLTLFCPFGEIKDKAKIGISISENERWKIINYVTENNNWGPMAYQFTDIILEYVDINILKQNQPIAGSYFTNKLISDKKYRKEILSKIMERKVNKSKSFKRNKKNKRDIENYPGERNFNLGFKLYNKIDKFDVLYENRIKEIEFELPEI
ncbi:MAG: hypothetical protein ACFFG0_41015, partial [Candidatus Thorarchaeota archaeon]